MIVLEEKLYTSEETADILGINTRTLYRYLKKGDIEAETKTKSGTFRFSRNQIYKYLYPDKYQKILEVLKKKENHKHTYLDNSVLDKVSFNNNPHPVNKSNQSSGLQGSNNNANSPNPSPIKSNTTDLSKNQQNNSQNYTNPISTKPNPSFTSNLNNQNQQSGNIRSQDTQEQNSVPTNSYAKDLDDIISNHSSEEKVEKQFNNQPNSQTNTPPLNSVGNQNISNKTPDLPNNSVQMNSQVTSQQQPQKAVVSDEEIMQIRKERENKNLDSELKNLEDSINGNNKSQNDNLDSDLNNNTDDWKYYVNQNKDILQLAKEINALSEETGRKYAATMKGGLSLHHDIDEFNQVHFYVEPNDLNWWVSHLELSYAPRSDSNICLIPCKNPKLFEQSYKLRGLYVVPDEVLIQDLMKHGEKELAKTLL